MFILNQETFPMIVFGRNPFIEIEIYLVP